MAAPRRRPFDNALMSAAMERLLDVLYEFGFYDAHEVFPTAQSAVDEVNGHIAAHLGELGLVVFVIENEPGE